MQDSMSNPPQQLLPVLERLKTAYILWCEYYQILPKIHRHTLGERLDILFIEIIEAVAYATFLWPREKQPYVLLAIRKLNTLTILLMVLWETKSLDTKKYVALSSPLDVVGKMLGGWNGQLTRQNTPAPRGAGEK